MRVRITATVALLTLAGLALAGLSVYAIERGRVDDRSVEGAQQELDEFAKQLELTVGTGETSRAA